MRQVNRNERGSIFVAVCSLETIDLAEQIQAVLAGRCILVGKRPAYFVAPTASVRLSQWQDHMSLLATGISTKPATATNSDPEENITVPLS